MLTSAQAQTRSEVSTTTKTSALFLHLAYLENHLGPAVPIMRPTDGPSGDERDPQKM